MLQTTPVQNQTGYGAMLPDASDRASSIVGFDINKYVFGEDSFSLQNPSGGLNQTNQNPVNQTVLNNGNNKTETSANKANNVFSSLLLLGVLGLGAFAAVKGLKSKDVKLPKFSKIKEYISKFKNNFKKPEIKSESLLK